MSSCAMASGAAPLSVTAWHILAADAAAAQLGTDPALGLSEAEVAARLERHGPNQISEGGVAQQAAACCSPSSPIS